MELTDSLGNPVNLVTSIPRASKHVVIMSHGFTSNLNSSLYIELENRLDDYMIGTARYEYYGHGPLYGHNNGYAVSPDTTLTKASASLQVVIDYLENYDLGLLGSSFGGLLSIIGAAKNDIKALVLKSTVTEPKSFWEERLGEKGIKKWRKDGTINPTQDIVDYELDIGYLEDLDNYDTLNLAKNIKCPMMILHGTQDECVPISQSRLLSDEIYTPVRKIEGADHSYKGHEEIKDMMVNFLVTHLRG